MNPESFRQRTENKLYIIKDVEGEPNHEELELIREIEKKLSQHEAFIGLAPFGSIVSGYNVKTEKNKSDIDLFLLFDGKKLTENERKYYLLDKEVEQIRDEVENRTERKISVIIDDINLENIVHDIKLGLSDKNKADVFPSTLLGTMSRIVTGTRIDEYRKIIADELRAFTPEQQNHALRKIADNLIRFESASLAKRKDRVPDLSETEHEQLIERRIGMWKKRLQKIWNLRTE